MESQDNWAKNKNGPQTSKHFLQTDTHTFHCLTFLVSRVFLSGCKKQTKQIQSEAGKTMAAMWAVTKKLFLPTGSLPGLTSDGHDHTQWPTKA